MKALALLILIPAAAAAQTTYDINFTAGSAATGFETITGTIIAEGSGSIATIDSWALDATGTAAFDFTGGSIPCGPTCGLIDQAGALVFMPQSDAYNASCFSPGECGTNLPMLDLIGAYGGPLCNSCVDIRNQSDDHSFSLASGTVLGFDPPSASSVPEVSGEGAAGALTLLAGLLAVLRRRCCPPSAA